jgi:hypothetical protein
VFTTPLPRIEERSKKKKATVIKAASKSTQRVAARPASPVKMKIAS